jgi:hypothetical protein
MSSPRDIARRRGERLWREITSLFNGANIASRWTSYSDLAANGWVRGTSANSEFPDLATFDFDEFFSTIKLKEENIDSIDWTHPANGVARYCHL